MKSDVIKVFGSGEGIDAALEETARFSEYNKLDEKDALRLRLLSEETVGLVTAIAGDFDADFWLEAPHSDTDKVICQVHLLAKTRVNPAKKEEFIKTATNKKNSAYSGFMGKIREVIENGIYSYEEAERMRMKYGYASTIYDAFGAVDDSAMPTTLVTMWTMDRYKMDIQSDLDVSVEAQESWDELERSIVANIADDIKVSVKGDTVEMIIEKDFRSEAK